MSAERGRCFAGSGTTRANRTAPEHKDALPGSYHGGSASEAQRRTGHKFAETEGAAAAG